MWSNGETDDARSMGETEELFLCNDQHEAEALPRKRRGWLPTLSVLGFSAMAGFAFCFAASSTARPVSHETEPTAFLGLSDSSDGKKKTCSSSAENCWKTRCCEDPDSKCYMKNGAWAGCLKTCKMGIHHSDPEEVQTPWTCFEVQEEGPALPPKNYEPPSSPKGPAPSLPGTVVTQKAADDKWPKLFCFGVIRTKTYELGLVQKQYALKASYFGCEEWAILSDNEIELAPGVKTIPLGSLETGNGVRTHFANTDIFSRAFDKLKEHGVMMKQDFVVKLDPDAVFMPSILKDQIRQNVKAPEDGGKSYVYFQNCQFQNRLWMFGAIEVISIGAMDKYFESRDNTCKKVLDYYNMGEDTFLARCLDHVGVEAKQDFNLLSDGYCEEAPGDCSSKQVAYHPFKDPMSWEACFRSAVKR